MDASQVIIKNNARVVFAGYAVLQEAIARGYLFPRGSAGNISLAAISQGNVYVTPQELQVILNTAFPANIPIQPVVATGTPIFFRFNAQRTGQYPYFATSLTPSLKWSTTPPGASGFNTTPLIGLKGFIYSAAGPTLFAISEFDGSIAWSYTIPEDTYILNSPPIFTSIEQIVGSYATIDYAKVYCINSVTGALIWTLTLDSAGTPLLNSKGELISVGNSGINYISSTGTVLYKDTSVTGTGSGTPSMDLNDNMYINYRYSLISVNTYTRKKNWEITAPIGVTFRTSPAIGPTGRIYIGSDSNGLFIYDLSGNLIYNHRPTDNISKDITVGYDDTCFMLISRSRGMLPILEALDRTNTVLWSVTLPVGFLGSENTCLGGDGYLYISQRNFAYCYNSGTGQLVWSYQLPGISFYQPSIGTLGNLYFLSGYTMFSLKNPGNLIPWQGFGNTRDHSSLSLNVGPTTTIQSRWEATLSGTISSSPIQGPDGTVYVGSDDGFLWAFSPITGTLQWKVSVGNIVQHSCTVNADATVYVCTIDGFLTAVNKEGSILWKFRIQIPSSGLTCGPTIGADGTIYIASQGPDASIYAINPNGSQKWRTYTGFSHINSSVAIANDGSLYVGANEGFLIALNSDGSSKWNFRTQSVVQSTPSIAFDGTIYVTSSCLEAINPNGTIKWRYFISPGRQIRSSPAITPLGYIVFYDYTTTLSFIYQINPDGTLKYKPSSAGNIISGIVSVGSDGSYYYTVKNLLYRQEEQTGNRVLNYTLPYLTSNQPIIGLNRYLYIPASTKLLAYSA